MLYCGVYLYGDCFNITVLTEGFGFLGRKHYRNNDYEAMFQWIASLQIHTNEHRCWFFDKSNFSDRQCNSSIFNFKEDINKIHMVDHRKIVNIIQFFGELGAKDSNLFLVCDLDESYILASSIRLFDVEVMTPLIP